MKLFSKYIFCLLFTLVLGKSWATHQNGGFIDYEIVSIDSINQTITYEVTITTYLDCASPFWGLDFPSFSEALSVLEGGFPMTSATAFDTVIPIAKNFGMPVEILQNDTCDLGSGFCDYYQQYKGQIILPFTNVGYYFTYIRCCRTGGIINIVNSNNRGMAVYAWAAPTVQQPLYNSNAILQDTALYYSCVGDTAYYNFNAFDPDGDSLVYSLVTPYNGASPPNYPWTINYPLGLTPYNPGYSGAQPFGPNSLSFINPVSGLMQWQIPLAGRYVVGVMVQEYRNGVLVGVSVKDIQVTAFNCPPNDPPQMTFVQSNQSWQGDTMVDIRQNENICFTVRYSDPDLDTINLSFQGNLLSVQNKVPPTIDIDTIGPGEYEVEVCWQSYCDSIPYGPFILFIEAADQACPSKPIINEFVINIEKIFQSASISGADSVCMADTISTDLWTNLSAFDSAQLSVSAGSFLWQGDTINYENSSPQDSAVFIFSGYTALGCPLGVDSHTVHFKESFAIDIGADTTLCSGDSIRLFSGVIHTGDKSYLWSNASGSLSDTNQSLETVVLQDQTIILRVSDNVGCVSKDTVQLYQQPIPFIQVPADTVICPGDEFEISINSPLLVTDSIPQSRYVGDNQMILSPPVPMPYLFSVTDSFGCVGYDTLNVGFQLDYQLAFSVVDSVYFGDELTLEWTTDYTTESIFNTSLLLGCNNCTSFSLEPEDDFVLDLFTVDSLGCFPKERKDTVGVIYDYLLTVPSAFTPNGDDKNDIFYPVQFGYETLLEFSIYDRWGNQVFFSNDWDVGWDGTVDGVQVNTNQVFVYKVVALRYNGEEEVRIGRVTLVY